MIFALTVSLALSTNIVAKEGSEDEILFGSELIERTAHDVAYCLQTFGLTKIKVQTVVAHRLDEIPDTLVLQSRDGKLLVFLVEGEEHHLAYTLLILINMVHEHLHIHWHYPSFLHGYRGKIKVRA